MRRLAMMLASRHNNGYSAVGNYCQSCFCGFSFVPYSFCPQPIQNFAFGGSCMPHFGHIFTSDAPHSMQNWLNGVGLPHAGQGIIPGAGFASGSPHSRQNFAPDKSGFPHFAQLLWLSMPAGICIMFPMGYCIWTKENAASPPLPSKTPIPASRSVRFLTSL
jgi:hypothetical protein